MSDRYEQPRRFISKKMSMSHIYQPVMLLELLRHRGVASKTAIAKVILLRDRSSTTRKSRDMVGKVLTKNHGITERRRHVSTSRSTAR